MAARWASGIPMSMADREWREVVEQATSTEICGSVDRQNEKAWRGSRPGELHHEV
jgi:hypothetical protein